MNTLAMKRSRKLEAILWSVALPGFAQLLNRKYIKGILLIGLEFIINVMGNFNRIIVLSFHGQMQEAVEQTNYMWLMFYPCLYFFAIWDAYRDAGGGEKPFAYLPLVFSAYFVTLGLIFSPNFTLFGYLIGPVWLPILFLPIGLGTGALIKWMVVRKFGEGG
ncbi:hypothetical protein [Virgibacillus sediminis]|uniref:Uncharacterized protein n=1 Tax=Virgibacillus sediminis TaxID=202260 RepID=A0ABV7A9D8_9BACI